MCFIQSFIQKFFVIFHLVYCLEVSRLEHPVLVSGQGGKQVKPSGALASRCSIWPSGPGT